MLVKFAPHQSKPFVLSLLAVVLLVGTSTVRAVTLNSAIPNSTQVPCYEEYELRLDLQSNAQNPFDPNQIDVEADFYGPNGTHMRIPGFLYQPFTTQMQGNQEVLIPTGPPEWRIRFAPNQVGWWTCFVSAQDSNSSATLSALQFECVPSSDSGFIQRAAYDNKLFAYSNGKPYFPIGENMAWAGSAGSSQYDQWLRNLSSHGGNLIRLWMFHWHNTDLEWSGPPPQGGQNQYIGYHGLGYYALENAWMVDRILDLASKYNINVLLCLDTFLELGPDMWGQNPYNAANGGPCQTPDDFWTNTVAQRYYKQKLRYIVARYGWRANLFGWEFWNETVAPASWVQTMGDYLKGNGMTSTSPIDPYNHLISTTYGDTTIWQLPEVDFTMTHSYGVGDIPDSAPVVKVDAQQNGQFSKPHLMAEFGIDWRRSDSQYDPNGSAINLHNALWSSIVSGDGGGAMIWYWDDYIDAENLYWVFDIPSKFVSTVPWQQGSWQSVACDQPQAANNTNTFYDAYFLPQLGWAQSATDFTLNSDGSVQGGALPKFLFSPGKPNLRSIPNLHVHFTQPGQFILDVYQVSNFANLQVMLDGVLVREFDLSASPPSNGSAPDYRETQYQPQ